MLPLEVWAEMQEIKTLMNGKITEIKAKHAEIAAIVHTVKPCLDTPYTLQLTREQWKVYELCFYPPGNLGRLLSRLEDEQDDLFF